MKSLICLHWTAGNYIPSPYDKEHYHGGVISDKGVARYGKWHSYEDNNVPGLWQRNSESINITVCAMANATTINFGKQPITVDQIEELCLAAAEIAFLKGIDTVNVKTHAEMADKDGYFGERWDLARLEPGSITPEIARKTGDKLRQKIRAYKIELQQGLRKLREIHRVSF